MAAGCAPVRVFILSFLSFLFANQSRVRHAGGTARTRGVHGNGGILGSHGSRGIPMGMGVKTWELEKRRTTLSPATVNSLLFFT